MKIEDIFPGFDAKDEDTKQKAIEWMKQKYPGLFPQWPEKK